jgi:integrase
MTDESKALTTTTRDLATRDTLAGMGKAADAAASKHLFADYRSRKAANTIRRQDAGLALFADFLAGHWPEDSQGDPPTGDALATNPQAWAGITWGLVKAFVAWQLEQGYSVGSVNVRLSTVRTYAKLAAQAGAVDVEQMALIKAVQGYGHKEGKHIDEKRQDAGLSTRVGTKKADPVRLTTEQAGALKHDQPLTPQGRRDTVLMCLLLDHGLRASEVAALMVSNFDLKEGTMTFYRVKVDKHQTHKLTEDTRQALEAYFELDALAMGPLLRESRKDGRLHGAGVNERNITERVKVLGEAVGVKGLSAHDCRHYAATRKAAEKGVKELMEIFGWKSTAMAMHYIEDAKVIEVE